MKFSNLLLTVECIIVSYEDVDRARNDYMCQHKNEEIKSIWAVLVGTVWHFY